MMTYDDNDDHDDHDDNDNYDNYDNDDDQIVVSVGPYMLRILLLLVTRGSSFGLKA